MSRARVAYGSTRSTRRHTKTQGPRRWTTAERRQSVGRRRTTQTQALYDGVAQDVACSVTSAIAAAGVIRVAAKLVQADAVDRVRVLLCCGVVSAAWKLGVCV